MQEILQTFPYNSYYMYYKGKIKNTMQEILKKSFVFYLAFSTDCRLFGEESCILKDGGLQVAAEMENMVRRENQGR